VGLLAKRATAKLAESASLPVGPWMAIDAAGPLNAVDLLTLACHAAVLRTDVGNAESPALSASGKVSPTSVSMSTLRSLLQVRETPRGPVIACGAAKGQMAPDWELLVSKDGNHHAVAAVQHVKTRDDQLINGRLLDQVRTTLGGVLESGLDLKVKDGPPDLGGIVQASVLRKKSAWSNDRSPFTGDYFLPIPDEFTGTPRIELPVGSAHATAVAAQASAYPGTPGDGPCLRSIDLSGGRPGNGARLLIVSDTAGERVEVILPEPHGSSAAGMQRTFRAAMIILGDLADRIKDESPEASQAVGSYVRACIEPYAAPDRAERFQPAWDENTPADVVPVTATIPIAITTRNLSTGLIDHLWCAQSWLLVRQRTWSTGFGKTKSTNFNSRRPVAIRKDDQTIQGKLRYGADPDSHRPDAFTARLRNDKLACFWECRVNSAQAVGGKRDGALVVSGLAQTDGMLAYGADLMTLLRAFCWSLESADPKASISTVYLQQTSTRRGT
jgi:hypothetical protein